MKRFFLFPGLELEGAGVIVILVAILNGNTVLLLAGVGIICIAWLSYIFRFLQISRMDTRETPAVALGEEDQYHSILYADRLVRITDNSIIFLSYSFPFFSSGRQVFFRDIDHIDVKKPTILTGKWRIGGSGDFQTWFPLDWGRPSRDRIFHATLKCRAMNIGFTVEDSTRVTSILKAKGLHITESDR